MSKYLFICLKLNEECGDKKWRNKVKLTKDFYNFHSSLGIVFIQVISNLSLRFHRWSTFFLRFHWGQNVYAHFVGWSFLVYHDSVLQRIRCRWSCCFLIWHNDPQFDHFWSSILQTLNICSARNIFGFFFKLVNSTYLQRI